MGTEAEPYRAVLSKWLPGCHLAAAPATARHIDAIVRWKGPAGPVTFVLQVKRHFATQDAATVAHQFRQFASHFKGPLRQARLLLVAPYVRPQQAEVLLRAGIDFIDQAGNAHLEPKGLRVDALGRRPPKARPGRAQINKGWVRTTMALLLRPDLEQAPYRAIAAEAGVALGTVLKGLHDLRDRGFLQGEGDRRVLENRRELVALWVQAYVDRLRPTLEVRRVQVKADDKAGVLARLRKVLEPRRIQWHLTGADAGERLTHHYRAAQTEIYAAPDAFGDPEVLKALPAQPAQQGGNLWVIEPPAPIAANAARIVKGVPMAPALLVYAELRYEGTDQAREAAELLLPKVIADVA
jgi:hypothetical protein